MSDKLDTTPQTITVKDVAKILGVSVGTVYNLANDPKKNFPAPVPLGLRGKRWSTPAIRKYAKFGPLHDQVSDGAGA